MTPLDAALQRQFDLALKLHQAGRLAEAEPLYRQVLASRPLHGDSLHLLGLIAHQSGRSEVAADLIGRACTIDPRNPAYLLNLGIVLRQSGRLPEAEAAYRRVLKLQPENAAALSYLGNALRDQGRLDQAVETYRRALRLRPDDAATHHNLGVALVRLGRLDAAIASYRRALALRPDNAEALNDLGVALSKQQKPQEAIEQFSKAVALGTGLPEAHAHLARLLEGAGRLDEAVDHYQRALALRPDHADAAIALGVILLQQKRRPEALAVYDSLLARGKGDASAYNNHGLILRDLGRLDEALADFDRALALDPAYALACANRGHTQLQLGQYAAAIGSYDETLRLDPEAVFVRGGRLDAELKLCRWASLAVDIDQVVAEVEAQKRAVTPFILMCALDDPGLQRAVAADYASELVRDDASPRLAPPSADGRIRLGYFSPDFRNHPVSKLVHRLLQSHDRARFEVTAFALVDAPGDADRATIASSVDHFIDVSTMATDEIVSLVRARGVDIAIDLAGYTFGARPDLFAARCAPTQVNFLGYPGTMGAEFMDYLIADRTLIGAADQDGFAEKIVTMPDTYGVNSYRGFDLDYPDPRSVRATHGLPEDAFVFCCFNSVVKLLPKTFDSWMTILKATRNSVLWITQGPDEAVDNLRREAKAKGVDPSRLIFAPPMPFRDHMTRYRAADLFLDTLPYNAHTTSADALWMGLPVLTLKGRAFAGRVAASFLTAVGLTELITTTAGEYEALAIRLAGDPDRLTRLRRGLEDGRLTAPLFDTARYTRHLEDAFEQMHQRRQAGLAADHIVVGS